MQFDTLSRENIYDLVWTTPLTALAKKYNISDNGLRKLCARMNIPLPKNGHWQRLKHGKISKKSELPTTYQGDSHAKLELIIEGSPTSRTVRDEIINLKQHVESDLNLKLRVPDRLTRPELHLPLISDRFKVTLF